MRGFPGGGGANKNFAGKGFFGPAGVPSNVQIFGAAGGTWTKPTPPQGASRIIAIQFIAVGAGAGGTSGSIAQASGSGISGTNTPNLSGGGGGFCSYLPAVASVPASVVITCGSGGAGGAGQTISGSFPGNGNSGNVGAAGSANTTVGTTVIVCTPGGSSVGGSGNGFAGGGSCTGAWGGTFTTQSGGRGGYNAQPHVTQSTYPTNAQRQTFSTGASFAAGESVSLAPGGGGEVMGWLTGGIQFTASCFGGGPGGVGGSAGNDTNITIAGPSIPSITATNGSSGASFQGGGAGGCIFINPTSSPAGNLYTMITGVGGNGGAGAGGGCGGWFSILSQLNPGTVTASAGGNGGDGQVVVITSFA